MVTDLEARRSAGLPLWSVYFYDDETQYDGKLRWYAEMLKTLPGIGSILDIGCGNGALLTRYPDSPDYLGVDVVPGLIEEARVAHPGNRFLCADALSAPLPRFDTVVMIGILGLSPRPIELIERACSLARHQLLFDFLEDRPGRLDRSSALRYLSREAVTGRLAESGIDVARTHQLNANVRLIARRSDFDGTMCADNGQEANRHTQRRDGVDGPRSRS